MCSRKQTDRLQNAHFVGFNFKLAFLKRFNASSKRSGCSVNVRQKIIISSKYARQELYSMPLKTTDINRINIKEAVEKPNGIIVY